MVGNTIMSLQIFNNYSFITVFHKENPQGLVLLDKYETGRSK